MIGCLGTGLDVGVSFDPNGQRPGASPCDSGSGVGTFGDYGASARPLQFPIEQFGGGIGITNGNTHSEGPTLSGNATFGNGKGFDIGGGTHTERYGVGQHLLV